MKRTKLRGLKRNAPVVLGNVGSADDVPSLVAALSDPEPLPSSSSGQAVRGHAVWALGRIASPRADAPLRERLRHEPDDFVREELRLALADFEG